MWHVSISNHTSPICVMITELEVCVRIMICVWVLWDAKRGCPPSYTPPFPLTLGGNYLVMQAPFGGCFLPLAAPSGPPSPILPPCGGGGVSHTCTRPRLKAPGLILNQLALAFSWGGTRLICSHKGPSFFPPLLAPSADRPAAELLLAGHSSCGARC